MDAAVATFDSSSLERSPHLTSSTLALLSLAVILCGCADQEASSSTEIQLLNVSYDPTRELWKDLNAAFAEDFASEEGKRISIRQSHGASGSQARAVIDGLDADVVSLAMWTDTDALRKKGLLASDWEDRLPKESLPYFSTIVFVVRKGNPQGIRDWPDLSRPGISVITPSPKTSGNGKLSFLAGWGSVILNGGSEDQARSYLTQLYRNVPVLDTGARGATVSFAQRGLGTVHLTWENEARLEIEESRGQLEIVYPSLSILAEPRVAVVDAVVDRRGTREAAEEYLRFLYKPAGQEIISRHFYRPSDETILAAHRAIFPEIKLFRVSEIVSGWDEAQAKFFADGGVFDQIYDGRAHSSSGSHRMSR
jgi:sulfate transport system substrate-binding protein